MTKKEKKQINKRVNSLTKKIVLFLIWFVFSVTIWGFAAPTLISWDDNLLVVAGYSLIVIHAIITARIVFKIILKMITR